MTETPLLLDIEGPVARITLNRPDKLNALSAALVEALRQALDRIEADPGCRVVVITGTGRAFCAGGDLTEFRSHLEAGHPDELERFVRGVSATFSRLETLSKPVIAAVNGVAVAGGLELVLACDLVIAAEGSTMGDGHVRYGVLPGGGAAARLPRKVPQNVAAELFLMAESKPVEWWQSFGVVNRIVPHADLAAAASNWAETIAKFSPLAVADMKRMTLSAKDTTRDAALAQELEVFATHTKRADFLEGLRAFAERRPPIYRGH
ncbi:enoyl-CoA hydratase/isomerase family protein [Marinibacterium sp. SX1]|uniref:enoyl-CoA hydratase/isomerase family protein n=1 Tax=Marinibacterium sp. SX1 TaxID=3388424 RepID=UPI003D17E895